MARMTIAGALRKDRTASNRPTFQHRHYAAIAKWIAEIPAPALRQTVAEFFADRLALTNARFDRARFLRATGTLPANVGGGTQK